MSGSYRTNDGKAVFSFNISRNGSLYDSYITRRPDYANRDTDPHITHRYPGNPYDQICFGDPTAVDTAEKARKFSEAWAEMTWEYIKTGKDFEKQAKGGMSWGGRLVVSAALAAFGIPFI